MLRPSRPEKARVEVVSSGFALPIASLQAGASFASGVRNRPVPICTADAPRTSAAAIPRASAMPPVATTGTRSPTASTTAGSRANSPTRLSSAASPSNVPRWPPASMPCAMTTSAPAATAASASATVVTLANQLMPFSFIRATKAGG